MRTPNAKLSVEEVKLIKQLLANGFNCCVIAREAGVSRDTISLIKNGKRWKDV